MGIFQPTKMTFLSWRFRGFLVVMDIMVDSQVIIGLILDDDWGYPYNKGHLQKWEDPFCGFESVNEWYHGDFSWGYPLVN